jgi:hypothetical protein
MVAVVGGAVQADDARGATCRRDFLLLADRKPVAVGNRSHPQPRPWVGAIFDCDFFSPPTEKAVAVSQQRGTATRVPPNAL